jgi:predicted dienelactone hydrolase
MRLIPLFAALAVGLMLCGPAPAALAATAPVATVTDYSHPGPFKVVAIEGEWKDAGRDRTVPWLIRYPEGVSGPVPVVIFSHGLGGSRRGAVYYADHLVSHGYVVVMVQHPGSDVSIWRGQGIRPNFGNVDRAALAKVVADPMLTINRFLDIPFALDQLALMNADGPLKGRMDLSRIGMSGHSFGAVTTQAMAGQVFPNGRSLPEPRFTAFLAMSPSGARDGDNDRAFGGVTRPFLSLTGTEDSFTISPGQGVAAAVADRQLPFAHLGGPSMLVLLTGGDHMVFSGRQEIGGPPRPLDDRHRLIIRAAALAWWDAWLKDDPQARAWLRDGGMAGCAGPDAAVSWRGPDH